MDVLLVRHAKAVDGLGLLDDHRPLTARGRRDALALGKLLRHAEARPDVIVTSPLVRAVETAELVAVGLKHEGALEVAPELRYDHRAQSVVDDVLLPRAQHGFVAVVGHEPQLGNLLRLLLRTDAPSPRKAAAIRLTWDRPDEAATFEWVCTPDLVAPSKHLADVG